MSNTARDIPPGRMSRAAFIAWSEGRPGRWERIDGTPVRMAAERLAHNRVKRQLWRALDEAIRRQRLACEAFIDGVRVEIDDDIDYEPDVLVACGPSLDATATAINHPVIVAEVTSRSTVRIDKSTKLADYFRLPSVMHYLIVAADRRLVLHHRRAEAQILSHIITSGSIACDPPDLAVALDDIYAGVIPPA